MRGEGKTDKSINILKEINVNPGNLTQEKELTKIGYRQGENGRIKKRERERSKIDYSKVNRV